MIPPSRLLETGPPEVQELLEAALIDTPGRHLLEELRAALGVSAVAVGSAAAIASASTARIASSAVGQASTLSSTASGAFARVAVEGAAAASTVKGSMFFVPVAKSLLAGALLGSAVCGGAMVSGGGSMSKAPPHRAHALNHARPAVHLGVMRPGARENALRGTAPEMMEVEARPPSVWTAPAIALPSDSPTSTPQSRHRPPTQAFRTEATAETGPRSAELGASTLAAELRSVDEARRSLNAGNFGAAVTALDEYDGAHPNGALKREALMLRVEVLYRQGNVAAARQLARRYIAAYSDLHADRMREIAGTDERGGAESQRVE